MSPDRILPGSAGAPDPSPEEGRDASVSDVTELDVAVEEVDELDQAPVAAPARSVTASTVTESAVLEEDEGTPLAPEMITPEKEHKGFFRRIYYGETRVDFVRRKRIWFTFSTVVILIGVISLGVRGLNFSIDFVGGTSWTVPSKTVTVAETNAAISAGIVAAPETTVLGVYGSTSRTIQVEAKLPKGETASAQNTISNEVVAKLAALTHTTANNVAVDSVGPSWGGQITHKALIALIVFFILIALYISIFFEWRMALAAIVAVLHDILVTVGIYSLSGFQVTPDTVVALLTILGYSLYDTIVVFDRVRDNTRHLSVRDRLTFSDVVNLSMNQTLARSINTSAVAIMPILSMLVLGAEILGASTLQYFGLALLVGLATGAYSSIFIASPLVAVMKEREPKYRILRERLAARGGDRVLLSAAAVASGAFGDSLEARGAVSTARARKAERPSVLPNTRPVPQRRPSSRGKRKGGRR